MVPEIKQLKNLLCTHNSMAIPVRDFENTQWQTVAISDIFLDMETNPSYQAIGSER